MKNKSAFDAHTGICYVPENTTSVEEGGYTYRDFLELTGGDLQLAEEVFDLCEGQQPADVLAVLETLPPVAARLSLKMVNLKRELITTILSGLATGPQPLLLFSVEGKDRLLLGATYADDSILDYITCLGVDRAEDGAVTGATIYSHFGNQLSLEQLQINDLFNLVSHLPQAWDGAVEVSDTTRVFGTFENTTRALEELYAQKAYLELTNRDATLGIYGHQLTGSYKDQTSKTVYVHIQIGGVLEEPEPSFDGSWHYE